MSTKNGKMKLNKKGGLVDYSYDPDHSTVSQQCLKFKSIQGYKDHCTLWKISPQNAMNFRNLSSCGTTINTHEIQ